MGRARIIHETGALINYNARFSSAICLFSMRTDDFDFILPERLIAQHPPAQRGGSRLLQVGKAGQKDWQFADLHGLVRENDLLILNDTRVLKARLFGLSPHDAATIAVSTAAILLVTLAAGFHPARRVSRVDAMVALRYE